LEEKLLKESSIGKDEFEILKDFISRIDENTANVFLASENGWDWYENLLKSRLDFDEKGVAVFAVNAVG
jgi:hypothetical protein